MVRNPGMKIGLLAVLLIIGSMIACPAGSMTGFNWPPATSVHVKLIPPKDLEGKTKEAYLHETVEILRERAEGYGMKGVRIHGQGEDRIRITVPETFEPAIPELLRLLVEPHSVKYLIAASPEYCGGDETLRADFEALRGKFIRHLKNWRKRHGAGTWIRISARWNPRSHRTAAAPAVTGCPTPRIRWKKKARQCRKDRSRSGRLD